jgi:purine-binding chemotaxis protein CheW
MQENETIDWQALWGELDWDAEARHERSEQILLRQRARQYASLPPDIEDETGKQTLLAFDVGDEQYAIDVMLVDSIRPIVKITPVPATPRFYRGVVNIRGQIVTVMDLRLFFDIDVNEREAPEELIVVNVNKLEVGILTHHVRGVISVAKTHIEPLEDVRYTWGITQNHILLLDLKSLFEDDRLIVGGADE